MNLFKSVGAILKKYGENATVTMDKKSYDIHAIIQPLRYQNKMYLDYENYDLGLHDNTCLLFIGPASPDFTGSIADTVISANGRKFLIKRADLMFLGDSPLYIRAVIIPRYKNGVYDSV